MMPRTVDRYNSTLFAFRSQITELLECHRPSKHPFFARLTAASSILVRSAEFLDELYKRYQGAMHATRVMVYFLPHLDSIDLRVRKIKVLMDDDAGKDGDTHHYQLRRTWTVMLGRPPKATDEEFAELHDLVRVVDPDTAQFVLRAKVLYPSSLGSWLMVEGLAHDWIGALLGSLLPHFPGINETDYFRENYSNCLEIQHASESLESVCLVLGRRPNLVQETISGAKEMGQALDALWSGFDRLLLQSTGSLR